MKRASSAMITRSQASARCIPPPAAVPFTPAITGFSQSRTDATSRWKPRWIIRPPSPTIISGAPGGFGEGVRTSRRSAPVQNPFSPFPVMTTARTA